MKKVLFNTIYQATGKIITSLLGIISFSILARYLSIGQMGEYNLILNFVSFLAIFADFGLGTILIRDTAIEKTSSNTFSLIYTLRLLSSILFIGFGSFLIYLFPYSMEVKIGVLIYALANIFSQLSTIIWATFQARLRFIQGVIIQVCTSFINCVLLILAVWFHLPFLYFIIFTSIASVCGYLLSISILREKPMLIFDLKRYTTILNQAWPLAAAVIMSLIYFKIDALILPYFYNPLHYPDVAYYGIAYKVFEVLLVFGGFYTGTLFPHFSSKINNKSFHRDFRKGFFWTLGIAVLGSAGLFLFAKMFILILGGSRYLPAVTSLKILALAFCPTILSGFFLDVAVAGKKQLLLFKCTAAAAVLNIVLNLIFIPQYSFIGASWITVLTQIVILITYIYVALLVVNKRGISYPPNPLTIS